MPRFHENPRNPGWSLSLPLTYPLSPSTWTLTSVGRAIVRGLCHPPLATDHPGHDFPNPAHPFESVDTQEEIIVAQVSGKLNKDLWREFNKHLIAAAPAQLHTPWRYLRRQFTATCKDVRSMCALCANLHSCKYFIVDKCNMMKNWHSKEIIAAIALNYCTHCEGYHLLTNLRLILNAYVWHVELLTV